MIMHILIYCPEAEKFDQQLESTCLGGTPLCNSSVHSNRLKNLPIVLFRVRNESSLRRFDACYMAVSDSTIG